MNDIISLCLEFVFKYVLKEFTKTDQLLESFQYALGRYNRTYKEELSTIMSMYASIHIVLI